uniref:vegetative cell wall protein gp1-like n=1 Tax=Odobenus rosmarus divergens TaxID=9708 RepID=UPI00063C67D1|nr:PREDICTED: vegetative cell wall protein gp1-like [Odobenus rosmarus divergens]
MGHLPRVRRGAGVRDTPDNEAAATLAPCSLRSGGGTDNQGAGAEPERAGGALPEDAGAESSTSDPQPSARPPRLSAAGLRPSAPLSPALFTLIPSPPLPTLSIPIAGLPHTLPAVGVRILGPSSLNLCTPHLPAPGSSGPGHPVPGSPAVRTAPPPRRGSQPFVPGVPSNFPRTTLASTPPPTPALGTRALRADLHPHPRLAPPRCGPRRVPGHRAGGVG